jgi:hypothetical protein
MKYYLNSEQYHTLWKNIPDTEYEFNREQVIKDKFNLTYTEFEHFWGSVSGNEKDINWFLLQL